MMIDGHQGWILQVLAGGNEFCKWPDGEWRLYRPSADERNPVTNDLLALLNRGAVEIRNVRRIETAFITDQGRREMAQFEVEEAGRCAEEARRDETAEREGWA